MARSEPEAPKSIADADASQLLRAMASKGIWLDLGATTLRVVSRVPTLGSQLQQVYQRFPLVVDADWADLHVEIRRPLGLRRWVHPQVTFHSDGRRPFEPFPVDTALPLLEWGSNWLIGQRLNHLLLLHAGVVERNGLALVLPAIPGSGKSTLTAALSLRGWRLLSDEFGAFDPEAGSFRAMLKPVALKNQSIAVIRDFAPEATLGPEFPKTRKGTVAHLAAESSAVARRHELAKPGAVVLPRWELGAATQFRRLTEDVLFTSLAFNAFNYHVLGEVGFHCAVQLARQCLGWELVYSDLDDALATLERAWTQVAEHQLCLAGDRRGGATQ